MQISTESFAQEYQVLTSFPETGQAQVFKCTNKSNQIVAVKKYKNIGIADFTRELDIINKLAGKTHIVQYKSVFFDQTIHVVMPFYPGGDLLGWIEQNKAKIIEQNTLEFSIMKQLAQGLAHMHEMNIQHRDIKPANVLLSNDCGTVFLADFGISKVKPIVDTMATQTTVYTPGYAAPEVVEQNAYGLSADIFSLGMVYCNLICKNYNSIAITKASELETYVGTELSKWCTPEMTCLIASMLSSDPYARPTAKQLMHALNVVFESGIGVESKLLHDKIKTLEKLHQVTSALFSGCSVLADLQNPSVKQYHEILAQLSLQTTHLEYLKRIHGGGYSLFMSNMLQKQALISVTNSVPDFAKNSQYKKEEKLHESQIAAVYLCSLKSDETKKVVLKKLRLTDTEQDKVIRHIPLVMNIIQQHENFVPYTFLFTNGKRKLYIEMPYFKKGTLATYLQSKNSSNWSHMLCIPIMTQLAVAVEFLHSRSLVHRDLKPTNIMVSDDMHTFKLCDYGLLKFDDQGHINTTVGATKGFQAPELVATLPFKYPITACDIFSLGCIFCAMASLSLNLDISGHIIYDEQHGPARVRTCFKGYPKEFVDLVCKMVAKDPRTRPNIKIVLQMLQRMQKGTSQEQVPEPICRLL